MNVATRRPKAKNFSMYDNSSNNKSNNNNNNNNSHNNCCPKFSSVLVWAVPRPLVASAELSNALIDEHVMNL